VAQAMYTHMSTCKNDKIKKEISANRVTH
jgi:hypothetical protein